MYANIICIKVRNKGYVCRKVRTTSILKRREYIIYDAAACVHVHAKPLYSIALLLYEMLGSRSRLGLFFYYLFLSKGGCAHMMCNLIIKGLGKL
jgi:hypothetical protein